MVKISSGGVNLEGILTIGMVERDEFFYYVKNLWNDFCNI